MSKKDVPLNVTTKTLELIERAMEQPGVKEVMKIYRHYEVINKHHEVYQNAMTPKSIQTTTSNTSDIILE